MKTFNSNDTLWFFNLVYQTPCQSIVEQINLPAKKKKVFEIFMEMEELLYKKILERENFNV